MVGLLGVHVKIDVRVRARVGPLVDALPVPHVHGIPEEPVHPCTENKHCGVNTGARGTAMLDRRCLFDARVLDGWPSSWSGSAERVDGRRSPLVAGQTEGSDCETGSTQVSVTTARTTRFLAVTFIPSDATRRARPGRAGLCRQGPIQLASCTGRAAPAARAEVCSSWRRGWECAVRGRQPSDDSRYTL